MAWIDKPGKKYRLRERINGKPVTVIKNLGIYIQHAENWLVDFRTAVANGFEFTPPITVADISRFNQARKTGNDPQATLRTIPIETMVDLFEKHCGLSVKGAKANSRALQNFKSRTKAIRTFFAGKMSDEPTKYDVRDFLSQYATVGTQMRYLGQLGRLYKTFYEWNEDDPEVLGYRVKLPAKNPATKWRSEMKPAQKREKPDVRVLTQDEWQDFKKFLKPRTLAICELALRRFLRPSDIKSITHLKIKAGYIHGLQEKTGEPFSVPVVSNQPVKYDFKNFRRDFKRAQIKAGMDFPSDHPQHFTIKDLRRTGATWAYRSTKDLVGISEMLGHTNLKTTRRYLNITETDKAKIALAVDRMASEESAKFGAPLEQNQDFGANPHNPQAQHTE